MTVDVEVGGADLSPSNPTTSKMLVVLFVDDEKHIVESLKDAMRRLPMTVLTATSGAAALRILAATAVDAVVSDELMPGMSGTELLAEVRETYPKIVRIILTGYAPSQAESEATGGGAVHGFVFKPCDSRELAKTIFDGVRAQGVERDESGYLGSTGAGGAATLKKPQPSAATAVSVGGSRTHPTSDSDVDVGELIYEIEAHRFD